MPAPVTEALYQRRKGLPKAGPVIAAFVTRAVQFLPPTTVLHNDECIRGILYPPCIYPSRIDTPVYLWGWPELSHQQQVKIAHLTALSQILLYEIVSVSSVTGVVLDAWMH